MCSSRQEPVRSLVTSWIFTSISHQGCFSDTLWSISKGQFLGVNLERDTCPSLAANWEKLKLVEV